MWLLGIGVVLLVCGFWAGRLYEWLTIDKRLLLGRCDSCNTSWVLWERDEPCPQCGGDLHYRERVSFPPVREFPHRSDP